MVQDKGFIKDNYLEPVHVIMDGLFFAQNMVYLGLFSLHFANKYSIINQ